jgi:DMSO/TMAO reductase YedYZ molybdopterin-dependent catalytic subunit
MTAQPERRDERPYGRAAFLGLVAAGVSALWWGDTAWRSLTHVLNGAFRAAGAPEAGGWRIYSVAWPLPGFDPASYRLRIDGMVARPLELTYADLLALPRAEQVSDFHCVTGWTVENVRWAGVRFNELLDRAGVQPGAKELSFASLEKPYVDGLTLEQALSPDAMLAYEMDGKPLARNHGAPARVVFPHMYGYKNVKWVSRITVVDSAVNGYWEARGYDRDAWVGRSNGY